MLAREQVKLICEGYLAENEGQLPVVGTAEWKENIADEYFGAENSAMQQQKWAFVLTSYHAMTLLDEACVFGYFRRGDVLPVSMLEEALKPMNKSYKRISAVGYVSVCFLAVVGGGEGVLPECVLMFV